MKKLTIAALTTALLAGAASANQTGFFVGVGAVTGAVTGQYNDKGNIATAGATRDRVYKTNTGKTMFGGRLEAGYGITFAGCGYASISVYGTLKSAKWTAYSDIGSPVAASRILEAKVRNKHDYGAEVKLGYHITKDTIGFIGIAAEVNKVELTWQQANATATGFQPTLKKSKSSVSAKPVIGLRTMFTKNMYLEAKYGYNFGSKVTLNVPTDANGALTNTNQTRTASIRPRTHEFSVTIGWRF